MVLSLTPREMTVSTREDRVLVYSYYTYLGAKDAIVPVRSARLATLDLIESLSAVPVLESAREAHRSDVCELGFLRVHAPSAPSSAARA